MGLNVEGFLAELGKISKEYVNQLETNINSYFGESLPFKNDDLVSSRLFSILVALQLKSMRNVPGFNYEQIEEKIFDYLLQLGFAANFRKEIDYFLGVLDREKSQNLYPLSGIAIGFLNAVISAEDLDKVLDKITLPNRELSPLIIHAVCHEFAVLVALSTKARLLSTTEIR